MEVRAYNASVPQYVLDVLEVCGKPSCNRSAQVGGLSKVLTRGRLGKEFVLDLNEDHWSSARNLVRRDDGGHALDVGHPRLSVVGRVRAEIALDRRHPTGEAASGGLGVDVGTRADDDPNADLLRDIEERRQIIEASEEVRTGRGRIDEVPVGVYAADRSNQSPLSRRGEGDSYLTVFIPAATIFCSTSSQRAGTGSRNGWNSPETIITRCPRRESDRESKET